MSGFHPERRTTALLALLFILTGSGCGGVLLSDRGDFEPLPYHLGVVLLPLREIDAPAAHLLGDDVQEFRGDPTRVDIVSWPIGERPRSVRLHLDDEDWAGTFGTELRDAYEESMRLAVPRALEGLFTKVSVLDAGSASRQSAREAGIDLLLAVDLEMSRQVNAFASEDWIWAFFGYFLFAYPGCALDDVDYWNPAQVSWRLFDPNRLPESLPDEISRLELAPSLVTPGAISVSPASLGFCRRWSGARQFWLSLLIPSAFLAWDTPAVRATLPQALARGLGSSASSELRNWISVRRERIAGSPQYDFPVVPGTFHLDDAADGCRVVGTLKSRWRDDAGRLVEFRLFLPGFEEPRAMRNPRKWPDGRLEYTIVHELDAAAREAIESEGILRIEVHEDGPELHVRGFTVPVEIGRETSDDGSRAAP